MEKEKTKSEQDMLREPPSAIEIAELSTAIRDCPELSMILRRLLFEYEQNKRWIKDAQDLFRAGR